jgi:DNA invertase Pin-like site-specific DNA recombinase
MRSPGTVDKNSVSNKDKKDESSSIKSQRSLLHSYLQSHRELSAAGENLAVEAEKTPELVEEYIDDGYSGADFNRPAFQRLLEDAKRGCIHIILVKDLQTLGTDDVIVGDYIETIFPLLNVRFIAVGNNYDSRKEGVDKSSVSALTASDMLHVMYGRKLSEKMRSARKEAWKTGHSTSGHAPYGYVKDSETKGKWRIDPEAGKVVKLIFTLACEGRNSAQIAHYLNDHHIPTPMVYNQTHKNWNDHSYVTKESERLWTAATVTPYLKRYEYTGAVVIGRNRVLAVGSRKHRKLPEDEWTVVEGVNEGIITVDEFEKAQKVIRNRKIPAYVNSRQYALKGKARCANCRCCLDFVDSGVEPYYICGRKSAAGGESKCSGEKYPAAELNRTVYRAVQEYVENQKDFMQMPQVQEDFGENGKLTKNLVAKFIDNVYVWDVKQVDIEFLTFPC